MDFVGALDGALDFEHFQSKLHSVDEQTIASSKALQNFGFPLFCGKGLMYLPNTGPFKSAVVEIGAQMHSFTSATLSPFGQI